MLEKCTFDGLLYNADQREKDGGACQVSPKVLRALVKAAREGTREPSSAVQSLGKVNPILHACLRLRGDGFSYLSCLEKAVCYLIVDLYDRIKREGEVWGRSPILFLADLKTADKVGLTLDERALLGRFVPRSAENGKVLDSPEAHVLGKPVAQDVKDTHLP